MTSLAFSPASRYAPDATAPIPLRSGDAAVATELAMEFPEALRRFDAHLVAIGRSDKTRHSYRRELTNLWCDYLCLQGLEIATVPAHRLDEYIAGLPANGSKRGDAIRAMKAMFGWMQDRVRPDDPTHHMKAPRPKAAPAPDLTTEAQRRLLRAAFHHEPRRGWSIMLVLATGARVGSIVATRRKDIHLNDPQGPWIWFQEVKGGVARAYEAELNRPGEIAVRHLLRYGHDPLLGVGAAQFRNWVHAAEQSAGLDRVWPHLLRHAFSHRVAKKAVQSGDLEAWRRAMNHADLSQFPRYNTTSRAKMRHIVS